MSSILLAGSLESFIQLLGALVIFVFVIVLVYFTTKWMGGIQKKRSYNKNLRIIETIGLGNNKMVSIVEAGEVYLVVAIGKEEVHLLAQLTRNQLKDFSFEQTEDKSSTESFAEIMEKLKDKLPKKQDRNE